MFVGIDDSKSSRIIMPTVKLRKTVSEICQESERSSNYRIIGLYKSGLLSVAKNNIDGKGRKVFTEAE
jgi:transcription elongation factor GreA-like protein